MVKPTDSGETHDFRARRWAALGRSALWRILEACSQAEREKLRALGYLEDNLEDVE